MSVQKAIFPGLIIGIVCVVLLTSLIPRASAHTTVPSIGVNQQEQAKTGECSINSSYPASVRQWCEEIERYARENGLDPNLVSAVMLQESDGQPDAYSRSGAVGLLQVMPRDGKAAALMCPNGPCFSDRPSMQELFDPQFNISYGTRMLAELVQRYGDVREALKAYGPRDYGYKYADLILQTLNTYSR